MARTPRFPGRGFGRRQLPLALIVAAGLLLALALAPAHLAVGQSDQDPGGASETPPTAPLHTAGGRLFDATGQEVRLTGVNWFGFETDSFSPHGLWARNYDDMLAQIAGAGFNTLRLPYSNQLLDPASTPKGIDYTHNPDLQGLSGLAVLDRVIAAAGRHGLHVILDRHRPTAAAQSELWYTDRVSEQTWIDDWVKLAGRYRGDPTVIGADLHNEPHGPATWGDGNPATDWRLAAERAGNAILATNPDWLIIVEGIERYGPNDWYWWGGNLAGARESPVRLSQPDKLVYSPHDYGPGVYHQQWFTAPDFPNNLPALWASHWAYLQQAGIAPVLVGEFGGRSVGQDAEGVWQRALLGFLRDNGLSYTYWSWNPDSGDTGGLLEDDWSTLDRSKLAMLSLYQWPSDEQPQSADQPPQPPAAQAQPADQPAGQPAPAPIAAPPVPAPPPDYAPGGPFDPDPEHAREGIGGPNDPDPAHRQARQRDEQRYLEIVGKPWPYAVYVTAAPATP